MTVKQALKLKNKLVKEINEELQKAHSYNSVEVNSVRPYSSAQSLENTSRLTNELIELKTKIHLANSPVYDKIFRLSELKSLVSKIKSLNCTEGTSVDYYSRRSENPPVMTAEISILERDSMVKIMEDEIESLQEELDTHNALTQI
jgi:hypothetical protein